MGWWEKNQGFVVFGGAGAGVAAFAGAMVWRDSQRRARAAALIGKSVAITPGDPALLSSTAGVWSAKDVALLPAGTTVSVLEYNDATRQFRVSAPAPYGAGWVRADRLGV